MGIPDKCVGIADHVGCLDFILFKMIIKGCSKMLYQVRVSLSLHCQTFLLSSE